MWCQDNHISKAMTGRKHLWVHDFNSIYKFLHNSGYTEIMKLDAFNSLELEFPIFPLDIDLDGKSRKGLESMYIAAKKN